MKKLLALLVFCFTAISLVFSVTGQEIKEPKKTVRVLTIGNSFADSLRRYYPAVAESADCKLIIGYLNIGGCTFERHWNNVAKELAEPGTIAFPGFKCTYLEKIKSEKWDFISVQQASGFSWNYETFQPYADNLIAFLQENCPDAEVVIQQTWAYHPAEKRLVNWGFSQKEMCDRLTDAYMTLAKKHNLRIIPTGFAVQTARETEPGGYNPDDSAAIFTADGYHLNARGQYLQACVWFGMLFDEPVSTATFQPKELTEADAAFLRGVAQKAIDEFPQAQKKD